MRNEKIAEDGGVSDDENSPLSANNHNGSQAIDSKRSGNGRRLDKI
jgi:hypothetical protein